MHEILDKYSSLSHLEKLKKLYQKIPFYKETMRMNQRMSKKTFWYKMIKSEKLIFSIRFLIIIIFNIFIIITTRYKGDDYEIEQSDY